MSGSAAGPTLRAAWNLRALGLFLLGPVVGVAFAAAIFGVPRSLLAAAGAMFLFSLTMFGVLVRGERRRLLRGAAMRRAGAARGR